MKVALLFLHLCLLLSFLFCVSLFFSRNTADTGGLLFNISSKKEPRVNWERFHRGWWWPVMAWSKRESSDGACFSFSEIQVTISITKAGRCETGMLTTKDSIQHHSCSTCNDIGLLKCGHWQHAQVCLQVKVGKSRNVPTSNRSGRDASERGGRAVSSFISHQLW